MILNNEIGNSDKKVHKFRIWKWMGKAVTLCLVGGWSMEVWKMGEEKIWEILNIWVVWLGRGWFWWAYFGVFSCLLELGRTFLDLEAVRSVCNDEGKGLGLA